MGNAAFLLAAIGLSVVASLVLWLRSRKPTSTMSSVEEFQREMRALARDPDSTPPGRGRSAGRRRSERS
jgi:hypothetical protein